MNPTDILLSIAIVGIYTLIYVYLKSKYDDNKKLSNYLFTVYLCNNNYRYTLLFNKIYSLINLNETQIRINIF